MATYAVVTPDGTVRVHVSCGPDSHDRHAYVDVVGAEPKLMYRSGSPLPLVRRAVNVEPGRTATVLITTSWLARADPEIDSVRGVPGFGSGLGFGFGLLPGAP